jgi:hypothetical protein
MHCRIEREGVARAAAVQLVVQVLQLGREEVPVVQHLLQLAGDAGRIMGCAQVARDDNQLAVARAVFVGSEFHGGQNLCLGGKWRSNGAQPWPNYAGCKLI